MNGASQKEMYDCKHGVVGLFLDIDDPPSKVIASTDVNYHFLRAYLNLCWKVTGEWPYYMPPR
jgi:hypothetical protein